MYIVTFSETSGVNRNFRGGYPELKEQTQMEGIPNGMPPLFLILLPLPPFDWEIQQNPFSAQIASGHSIGTTGGWVPLGW